MTEYTVGDVVRNLSSSRSRPSNLISPEKPGIYAIYLREMDHNGWFADKAGEAVYVGVSGNLKQRDFDTHFSSGKSGFSTLRRSLGAILRNELELECYPRSPGASTTNVTNYKFDPAGEHRLTLWMAENLDIGVCPTEDRIDDLEKLVISELRPLLNLKGWENPDRSAIRDLRSACKAEAENNRAL